jgi:hypothetical protein
MTRAWALYIVLLFLASCAPVQTPQTLPTPTHTIVVSTQPNSTHALPPTPTIAPVLPTLAATPQPCNPTTADYCITDGHFLFQRPILPPANTSVDRTYRFASTANGTRDPHRGVEFLNKFGTPVYAAGEGTVIFAGSDDAPVYSPWRNFYGNLVVIEHTDGLYTLYAHLADITVRQGQQVATGEQIGAVGQTGVAIGSHLHFEVRRGDVEDYFSPQNPELWLVPNQDETGRLLGALQLSVVDSTGQFVNRAEYTLEHYLDRTQPSDAIQYEVTYAAELLHGEENAGTSDLLPGTYRLALTYNGHIYERWVEVESGRLTQVVIVVN